MTVRVAALDHDVDHTTRWFCQLDAYRSTVATFVPFTPATGRAAPLITSYVISSPITVIVLMWPVTPGA